MNPVLFVVMMLHVVRRVHGVLFVFIGRVISVETNVLLLHRLGILLIPEVVERLDVRSFFKVVHRRRTGNSPLESSSVPRVGTDNSSSSGGSVEVDVEDDHGDSHQERTDGADKIDCAPVVVSRVGVDPTRHTVEAEPVHREEGEVKADEEKPERRLTEALVEHSAGNLRKPVVDTGESSEQGSTDKNVVEVRNHEVRVVLLEVVYGVSVHQAGKAAYHELVDKPESKQHRGTHNQLAAIDCSDPVEDLHTGGNRDSHGGERESRVGDVAHTGSEHVVGPYGETHESDSGTGTNHERVTEERLATEYRENLAHHPHGRQNENVHLGVTEYPEQVLPQDWQTTGRGFKEVGLEEPVEAEFH